MSLKKLSRAAGVAVLVLGSLSLAAAASQSDRPDDLRRLQAATEIFRSVLQGAGRQIPMSVLKSAECVAIVPGYKTLALGIGGNYGKGIALCRNDAGTAAPRPAAGGVPGWGAPIFITLGGANFGLQIGVNSADLLIMFQSRSGLERLLNNKLRLGASAAASAGPVGRYVDAATDATLSAQVVGYARSHGLFIGVNINGAIVQPDDSGNRAMYPHAYWQDVLDGRVAHPGQAQALISELNRSPYANPAVRARNPGAAAVPAGPALPFGPPERVLPFEAAISLNHISRSIGTGGWDAFIGWRPLTSTLPGLNLMFEAGHNTGSQSLLTTIVDSNQWTYLAGPEFDLPHRVFDPYVHLLFGEAHLHQTTVTGATLGAPPAATSSAGFNSFAWQAGGGLKLNITRWVSVRVVEVDWLHTSLNNNSTGNWRFSFGGGMHF